MNDKDIIGLFNARSEEAISETDKKYGGVCRHTAYNILGNHEDTEECVNDTYLKVWNVIPPKQPEKLGAFILRIVRNSAINLFKQRGSLKNGGGYSSVSFEEISEFLPAADDVDISVDRRAFTDALERFLNTLPKNRRVMFVRRYFYCSTYSDIAKEMHITEGSAAASVRRTREKLREFLEKEGIRI